MDHGYKFRFYKCLKNNVDRYYCSTKKICKAYGIQLNTNNVITKKVRNHNHEKDNDET